MKNFCLKSEHDKKLSEPGVFYFKLTEEGEFKINQKLNITKPTITRIKNNIQNVFKVIKENYKQDDLIIINSLNRLCGDLRLNFPGNQVVSITNNDLIKFHNDPHRYMICEKSDGIRYLLLQFYNRKILLLNRKLEFFLIETKNSFPDPINKLDDWEILNFIDGELVLDKVTSQEKIENSRQSMMEIDGHYFEYRFIVFDAIVLNGENIGHNPFKARISALNDFMKQINFSRIIKHKRESTFNKYKDVVRFLAPINETINKFQIKTIPIEIFMKDYFMLDKLDILNEKISKNKFPHDNDGIIINRDEFIYYPAACKDILKWKPAELNTVDFELAEIEIKQNNNRKLYVLQVNKTYNDLITINCLFFKDSVEENLFLTELKNVKLRPSRIIVECFYEKEFNPYDVINFHLLEMNKIIKKSDDEYTFNFINYNFDYLKIEQKRCPKFNDTIYRKGGWRFLRFRNDKETSNSYHTFKNVMISIEENITIDDLRDAFLNRYNIVINLRFVDIEEKIKEKNNNNSKTIPNFVFENISKINSSVSKNEKFLGNKHKSTNSEEKKEFKSEVIPRKYTLK